MTKLAKPLVAGALTAQADAQFDPEFQALHSNFVDSAKFFGKNGLLRLAMFVNVMTRPEQGEPDLFTLTIPSQQEGDPAIEIASIDGDVARFEPFAFSQEGQWTRLKTVIGGETKVYSGLPQEELENEIISRFNTWCMAHHPKEHTTSFLVRWDNAFKDVEEVAANLAAQRVDRRPA